MGYYGEMDISFIIIGGVFVIVLIIFAYCAAPFFWKRKPDA
jgi:hypothetical protein